MSKTDYKALSEALAQAFNYAVAGDQVNMELSNQRLEELNKGLWVCRKCRRINYLPYSGYGKIISEHIYADPQPCTLCGSEKPEQSTAHTPKQDGVAISSWAATEATEALKVVQADRYHMCAEYGEALREILAALEQQEQSE